MKVSESDRFVRRVRFEFYPGFRGLAVTEVRDHFFQLQRHAKTIFFVRLKAFLKERKLVNP